MAHPVVSRILVDSVAQAAVGESDPDEPEESPAEPTPPPPAEPPPQAAQAIAEAQQAAAFAREKEAEEAQAKARKVTPMRRPAAFGGAAPHEPREVSAAPPSEVRASAQEAAPGTPPPNGAGAPVSTAPAGLNAAIDALLATRVD